MWSEGCPYMPCVQRLFEHSDGMRVNQVSFFKAYQKHLEDVDSDKVEVAVYRLRAIMSQLANHKKKQKSSA